MFKKNVYFRNSYSRSGRATRGLTPAIAILGGSSRSESPDGSLISETVPVGNYGPNFEEMRTEAYEALEELKSMGLLESQTVTSANSATSNCSTRYFSTRHLRDNIVMADSFMADSSMNDDDANIEKVVENLSAQLSKPRLRELSASLGKDVNLAIILLSRLSGYTSLRPEDISHSLKVVRRGSGQRSIIYEGPSKGPERLLLQVVNHNIPDERYVLSLNGSVRAVQGIGMAFAGYFLGNNHQDLAILRPFMNRERIDLSYNIRDGTLVVRTPDDAIIKAKSKIPFETVLRRKKVFELLRGVA
ncbi:hypothetical protein HY483_03595 [Candidatus Woesearchaeota archaeon]|nr:hypothetical protein [Candidatus Woesearchaeota archaeon]